MSITGTYIYIHALDTRIAIYKCRRLCKFHFMTWFIMSECFFSHAKNDPPPFIPTQRTDYVLDLSTPPSPLIIYWSWVDRQALMSEMKIRKGINLFTIEIK